jgi:DNA-binding response OmpR family regulator
MDQRLAGVRVLVMEDEALVAMALEALLQDLGCLVVGPFASVATGIVAAETAPLDVALLDVNLRDGLVSPVAQRLHARGVPIVLHTACGHHDDLPPDLHDFARLTKPCGEARLQRELIALIGAAVA